MYFRKVQISELIREHAEKENGLYDLMELRLESIMLVERCEFLHANPQNKGNGYCLGAYLWARQKIGIPHSV